MDNAKSRATEQYVIDQIRRLSRQGMSVRAIAAISGKSTNTVLKYKDFPLPTAATPATKPVAGSAVPAKPKAGNQRTKLQGGK